MYGIEVGLRAERVVTVAEEMTASALGSGSLPLYSTAALIALMEATAAEVLEPCLPDGTTSVGTAFAIEHIAATPVGEEVRVQAEVVEVKGPSVVFDVRGWDEHDVVGFGRHTRFVVNIAGLMASVGDNT